MEEQVSEKINYISVEQFIDKLPEKIRNDLKEKCNKKVFFEHEGDCKVGTLTGIVISNPMLYVIDTKDKKIYVPCNNSLTLL